MEIEQLLPSELDTHVKNGTFRLAFVGMSNAGKSYRSRVLQNELDFFWYEVDANIQRELAIEDMEGVSAWLGHPTSSSFSERQQQYLEAEERCTHLHHLDTNGKNLVFDTTGSVIYLSDEAKNWLANECLIVNIDVGEDSLEKMTERFINEPKPVIWGKYFQPKEGEPDEDTFKRCYPQLLKDRLKAYRKLAHLTIPFDQLYDKTGVETLDVIKQNLKHEVS